MSFELNKIAGAILGTLLLVMGLGFLAEAIYAPIEGRAQGYTLPEPEEGGEATQVAEVEATPLPVLLANASAEDGAQEVRKCQSCHNFEEGAGNKTGPDLYGVVGRPIASHEGFSYSDALTTYASEHGDWTYETLAAFIHNPREDVPGTKMTFAGIDDEEDLANVLAYLQTLSSDPVPFPEPVAEEQAPADEAAAAEATEDEASGDEPAADEAVANDESVEVAEGAISEEPAAEDPTNADENAVEVETEEPAAEETANEEPATDEAAADTGATQEPAGQDASDTEEPAEEEPAAAEQPATDEATADQSAPADEATTSGEAAVDNSEAAPAGEASELEMAIANASLDDGEAVMRNCRTCHDWSEGGRNKIGPALYDVIGRQIGGHEGYNYSAAMTEFGEENGVWTYELLDAFLADPRGDISGTKMTFAGLDDPEDRAAAIAFLRMQSADPAPLAGAE